MKNYYRALDKLNLLTGDLYSVAAFIQWYLSLPFVMSFDVLYGLLRWLAKSKLLRQFVQSSFASIVICSVFFTLLIFAPYSSFSIVWVVGIKCLLLFLLMIPALNGLRVLDQKYLNKEDEVEDKMLRDARKQISVGVPDKQPVASEGLSIEQLTLQVRIAELEARQATIQVELDLKHKELEFKARELEVKEKDLASPLHTLKKEIATLETTKKGEDLGLVARSRDKDLTDDEKLEIGWNLSRQANEKEIRIVRVLEDVLKKAGYPNPSLFKWQVERNRLTLAYRVNANNPTLSDKDDYLEAIGRKLNSNSIVVSFPGNKAVEFIVSAAPHRERIAPISPEIEGENNPTVLQFKLPDKPETPGIMK